MVLLVRHSGYHSITRNPYVPSPIETTCLPINQSCRGSLILLTIQTIDRRIYIHSISFFEIFLKIIPGIILGLGFTLVPYILIDSPQLGVGDTLKLSWEKMRGHKMDYFILQLSFIGWILLSILTLGIVGILFAFPYMSQAEAIFCDRVLGQSKYVKAETVEDFTGFDR